MIASVRLVLVTRPVCSPMLSTPATPREHLTSVLCPHDVSPHTPAVFPQWDELKSVRHQSERRNMWLCRGCPEVKRIVWGCEVKSVRHQR